MSKRTNMIVLIIGLVGALAACSNQSETTQESAAPAQSIEQRAWAAIGEGALLIDVRTSAEFEQGHVDGAMNIPHDQITSRAEELGHDKGRTIVLYCRSGHRAGLAERSLQDLGFTHVLNAGGYESLIRSRDGD